MRFGPVCANFCCQMLWCLEVHQNDCSYIRELSNVHHVKKFHMVTGYIEDFKKPQNCQNWGAAGFHTDEGGGALGFPA